MEFFKEQDINLFLVTFPLHGEKLLEEDKTEKLSRNGGRQIFKNYLFIYLLAVLGLRCCVRAFSSCSDQGYSSLRCAGFSLQWLLLCGAWALGARASVVAARGLSSCGSRALERRLSSCGSRALERRLSSCGARA